MAQPNGPQDTGGPSAAKGAWDPAQYERFKAERSQPFFDLLALVAPSPGMRAVDLGCGTGELTRELHRRLACAETRGLDSSQEMLAGAAKFAEPGLRFESGDMTRFEEKGAWDLVFANASLHWADDHPSLFARLAASLRPRGQLAVQMPMNYGHASHVTAAEVAREEPFASALGRTERRPPLLTPEEYALLLHRLGFVEQHVRLVVYAHLLPSREAVIEWVKGTTLTQYRSRLSPELYERFLARYEETLLPRLADERPFLYPFQRVLLWGRRE
jgi:trans-aconitate 2-methyltransferase